MLYKDEHLFECYRADGNGRFKRKRFIFCLIRSVLLLKLKVRAQFASKTGKKDVKMQTGESGSQSLSGPEGEL